MDCTQRGFLGYNPRPAWLSFPQKPLGLRIFQGTVEDWQGEIRGADFPRGCRTFLICLCCGRAKVCYASFRNKSIMATGGVK
jgi:hypothetical protein